MSAQRCTREWAVILLPEPEAGVGVLEPDQLAASLRRAGVDVVLAAAVDEQILGDAIDWHSLAIIRSRDGVDPSEIAGMSSGDVPGEEAFADSVILPCERIDLGGIAAQSPRAWSEVEHPPSIEDPALLAVHLLSFTQGHVTTPGQVADRTMGGLVDPTRGVRSEAWFATCGTHRPEGAWDEVRCNVYPSRAAFMAVVFDPERLSGHSTEQPPALNDPYTLLVPLQPADLEVLSRHRA